MMRKLKIILIGGVSLAVLLAALLLVFTHSSAGKAHSSSPTASTISSSPPPAQALTHSFLFDKPLHEEHKPSFSTQDDPDAAGTLFCFYYPNFMVKEIDAPNNIGAEMLSITQISNGDKQPECLQEKADNERVIESGDFEGAKGDFLFFDTDGEGNGDQFNVFSNTGEKLFEDLCVSMDKISVKLIPAVAQSDHKIKHVTGIELTYDRVYAAQCSFGENNHECWTKAMKETGLKEAFSPECSTADVLTFGVKVTLHSNTANAQTTLISKIRSCYAGE
jgi:hypothetical protein